MSRTFPFISRLALVLLASLAIASSGFATDGAEYDGTGDPTPKEQWQTEYRRLLQEKARLERNAKTARENYSQAQQRNYPRGSARQKMLVDEQEAKQGLVEVEAEIERFKRSSRQDGVVPGWYYEVEEEPMVAAPQPHRDDTEDAEDREGRNPLYLDQE
jgi:hypothetical protein